MAKMHGVAGEWARVKGVVLGLWPLFLGVFAFGASVPLTLFFPLWGSSLFICSAVFVIVSLLRGLRHVERYFKGARGEERVSEILKTLPDVYHVFNDFTAGRSHVDHVVVGPGGVFSIETKFWSGKVTVEEPHILLDGQLPNRSPLVQATKEATIVRNALAKAGWNGAVMPVLTFASDSFVSRSACVRGVTVINSCELKKSFESNRVAIPPAELDRLVSIMESIS